MIGFWKRMAIITLTAAIAAVFFLGPVTAEAKERRTMVTDANGDSYGYKDGELRTGWFTYHGKRYYGHKTGSDSYPIGSVTKRGYRTKNNKLYYFTETGAKLTRNTRYIKLNHHSTSVHYIYLPGEDDLRYNANRHRYQYKENGRWWDVGMQCWPYALIDWQE